MTRIIFKNDACSILGSGTLTNLYSRLIMIQDIQDEHEFAARHGLYGGLIVDVRESNETELPFAVRMDLFSQNFIEFFIGVDKRKPILIYCYERSRSKGASRMLVDLGFEKVYQLQRNL